MIGKKKKVGDWVRLYGNEIYQIQSDPLIFTNNELATEKEIAEWIELTKLKQ